MFTRILDLIKQQRTGKGDGGTRRLYCNLTATLQGLGRRISAETVLEKAKVIDRRTRLKEAETYENGIYKIEKAQLAKNIPTDFKRNWEDIQNEKADRQSRLGIQVFSDGDSSIGKKNGSIVPGDVDHRCKSGTSGAGRTEKIDNLYCEVNENMKAYGVTTHRHTPEIEEQLSLVAGEKVCVNFTPHLVPMNRGILVTAYASLKQGVTEEMVREAYDSCYNSEKFVRVLRTGICPQTKWVEGSNYVDVGFQIDQRTNRIVILGAMDNLVKGAAGQAIQNMNLMFGLDETEGLTAIPLFP